MSGFRIQGTSGNVADVDSSGNLKVTTPSRWGDAGEDQSSQLGAIKVYSEVDAGLSSGTPLLRPLTVDANNKLKVASETHLDEEIFSGGTNYSKFMPTSSTFTATWGASGTGLLFNSGSSTGIGYYGINTRANFTPLVGGTLSIDMSVSFSASTHSGPIFEMGLSYISGGRCSDGVFFRLTENGLYGVSSFNGNESSVTLPGFTQVAGNHYLFSIVLTKEYAEFWINNGTTSRMYGRLTRAASQPMLFSTASLPISFLQYSSGGNNTLLQTSLHYYSLRLGGITAPNGLSEIGNRIFGSHQGHTGSGVVSLASYVANTNPIAGVPTSSSVLVSGLGGQVWETMTLPVNTDGNLIGMSVPASTIGGFAGRRLKISGVGLSSFVQTALVGGPVVAIYYLSFGGSTRDVTVETDTSTIKALRKITLPFTQAYTSGQAISTLPSQQCNWVNFKEPIYVNPGEFVMISTKHIGTAPSSGVVAHVVTFDYGWE